MEKKLLDPIQKSFVEQERRSVMTFMADSLSIGLINFICEKYACSRSSAIRHLIHYAAQNGAVEGSAEKLS